MNEQEKLAETVQAARQYIIERAEKELAGLGAAQVGAAQNSAGPKPWVKLSIEEKLERTREIVVEAVKQGHHTRAYLMDLKREVAQLRSDLKDHEHAVNGRALFPLERFRDRDLAGGMSRDDVSEAPAQDPETVYF